MSEMTEREAIPVTIGYMELYCESFKASAISAFSEQPTVSGVLQITNRCRKSTKLVFSGRVYNKNQPLSFIFISNIMNNKTGYEINYRGLKFTDCFIYGFTLEDKGEDFVHVTVTVVTPNSVEIQM